MSMEATEEMRGAYLAAWGDNRCSIKAGLEAVLAIVERERATAQEAAEKERRSAYQGEMTWDPPKLMTLELENVHGVEMMNLGHASRPSEVVTALHAAADDVDAVFLNGGRSE